MHVYSGPQSIAIRNECPEVDTVHTVNVLLENEIKSVVRSIDTDLG